MSHDDVPVSSANASAEGAASALRDAAAALHAGRWDEAEDHFNRGLASAPGDPRLHGGLALCAVHRKDWERAVSLGSTAAALPGAVLEVHLNLGWALEHAGRRDEALASYQRAFRMDPRRIEPIHHLLRVGDLPRIEEDDPTEEVPLETLQRVELYEAVGAGLSESPCAHTFVHALAWTVARQAPWAGIAAWLVRNGAHCDCGILKVLGERDKAFATTLVQGVLLADRHAMDRLIPEVGVFRPISVDEPVPANESFAPDHPLALRLVPGTGRAEIPAQRAHAMVVVGLAARILPLLGPEAALLLVVDPARHIGARRLWLLTPSTDIDVHGDFWAEPLSAAGEGAPLDLEGFVSWANLPLPVPVGDVDALRRMVDGLGAQDIVSVDRPGLLRVRGDRLEGRLDVLMRVLQTIAAILPDGESVPFLYRENGADRLVELRRGHPLALYQLRNRWPAALDPTELPVPTEVQQLARTMFDAPRALRWLIAE